MARNGYPAGAPTARFTRGLRNSCPAVVLALVVLLAACGAGPRAWGTPMAVRGASTEQAISLRADNDGWTWIDRLGGKVLHRAAASDSVRTIATVPVSTEGEQRGLLGYAVLAGRSFVAFTDSSNTLTVSELTGGPVAKPGRIVWAGTSTATKAIGGHLDVRGGLLVLGLGELDGWAKTHGSGALVTLDPDGPPGQEPVVLTDGWHNPFAFAVRPNGEIWVADNAPDGNAERIGRGDVARPPVDLPPPQRAPSAMAFLPDGRLAVCGFIDNDVFAYRVANTAADSQDAGVQRAGRVAQGCVSALTVDVGDGALVLGGAGGLLRAPRRT